MSERLYILSRTSGRPKFFARMRESVRALTWPNVVHIVHTDDPRDTYVEGDIVVYGEAYPPHMGAATYNLYNNRLLNAIPGQGWVAFIDDDDEYAAPDVFERLLVNGDKGRIHTGQVARWGDKVWNTDSKVTHRQFQTECFCAWSTIAKKGEWWSGKGGDHHYTRQLVKQARPQWHEVLIARAQEGKGSGKRVDVGGAEPDLDNALPAAKEVDFKLFISKDLRRREGQFTKLRYSEARKLEREGFGRVTYKGVTNESFISK